MRLGLRKKCVTPPCRIVYTINEKKMKIIKNFHKDDCIHFKEVMVEGCCGRKEKAGVCTIPDRYGNSTERICSTKMKWCDYQYKNKNQH